MDKLDRPLDELIKEDTHREPRQGGSVFSRLGSSRGKGARANASLEDMCSERGRGRGRGRGGQSAAVASAPDKTTRVMRQNRTVATDPDTGDVVTTLWQTEVVRITQSGDIMLNTGGHFTEQTMMCMNEALARWGFKVTEYAADNSWQVSDGKLRLIRFYDGVVIDRAAVATPAPESPRAAPGAFRAGGKGAHRYAPY